MTLLADVEDRGEAVRAIPAETADGISRALRQCIDLAPDFADAYYQLAQVNLALGENREESIGLLERALDLLPGRHDTALELGRALLQEEELDRARRIGEFLASAGTDTKTQAEARSLLASIERVAKQLKDGGFSLGFAEITTGLPDPQEKARQFCRFGPKRQNCRSHRNPAAPTSRG